MIKLNSQFVADATRSYVERDPRNMVGGRMIDELALALTGNGQFAAFVQDTDPTDNAICENCGKPAKYDSEMILCPACDLLSFAQFDRYEPG